MKSLSEARIAGYLAYSVIDKKCKVDVNKPGKQVSKETIQGQIEFKNVNFCYPTRDDVIVMNNFSCIFEKGKTTALVGPSGSGKSTVIQLIERFYNPMDGQILLDGEPIETLDLRSMRRNMGYVGQEPVLFNTTIKENMLFANPAATD